MALVLKINLRPAIQELCKIEEICSDTREKETASFSASSSDHSSYGFSSSKIYNFSKLTISESLAFSSLSANDFNQVIKKIQAILSTSLPKQYLEKVIQPFYFTLVSQGKNWFGSQLGKEEKPIERVVHAILQNFGSDDKSKIPVKNTHALREVIGDLYQKFLRNSCDLKSVCLEIPSPLPNWYEEGLSTFSRPDTFKELGFQTSIVNVPSRYAKGGAVAWGCLGHEVAGHDILGAYQGALDQLKSQIKTQLTEHDLEDTIPYWNQWLEEAAADVLGVLNMGPAAAFSLIAFLRTQNPHDSFKLNSYGYVKDEHPIDLVRGYLVAYTVEAMIKHPNFPQANIYAQAIIDEIEKTDAVGVNFLKLQTVMIEEKKIENVLKGFYTSKSLKISVNTPRRPDDHALQILNNPKLKEQFINYINSEYLTQNKKSALKIKKFNDFQIFHSKKSLENFKQSARVVAQTIMYAKIPALKNHSFSDIRCWDESDEKICKVFRQHLNMDLEEDGVENFKEGYFAAHVVSAAVMESITEKERESITPQKLQKMFKRMIAILNTMHRTNPEWQVSESFSNSQSSSGTDDS